MRIFCAIDSHEVKDSISKECALITKVTVTSDTGWKDNITASFNELGCLALRIDVFYTPGIAFLSRRNRNSSKIDGSSK